MKRFDAVIFDMDGLLLDSERLALAAFLETCEALCLGDKSALFKRCIGRNALEGKKILQEGLGCEANYEEFDKIWAKSYKARTEQQAIPVKRGAKELLDYIRSFAIPTAVATSTETASAIDKLRRTSLLDYFDIIIGGDQVIKGKPQPDIYQHAVMKLGARCSHSLALEDSDNGVKSALAAGLTVIQIPDLIEPSKDFRRQGQIILPNLFEVCTYRFK